jgi:hypothetical protein
VGVYRRFVVLKVLTLLRRHAVAFAAVFLLMGGSAYAAIDSATDARTSKRTLYACVTQTHKTLNLVSAERKCPNGQRKISWSAEGDRGARGQTGARGSSGAKGQAGADGARGATGATGTGAIGAAGATGATGPTGAIGAAGPQGIAGSDGTAGATGAPGPVGPSSIAHFFALMPPDNAATVAPGADVDFPQDGPSIGSEISRISPDAFNLASIGIYRIGFQVPVTEDGQLLLTLNGADLPYTVVGRQTGTTQIIEATLVETTTSNSLITVRNPAGNVNALTITPLGGGTRPVSASLIIERLGT